MSTHNHLHVSLTTADESEPSRIAVLQRFNLEEFERLSPKDLLLAQTISGHGEKWGVWNTSNTISPGKLNTVFRSVDLLKRLRSSLEKEEIPPVSEAKLNGLLEDGVLNITRLALLLRLAPTAGHGISKNQRLKPSSLAHRIYSEHPKILARAIRRKIEHPDTSGLFACLSNDDIQELSQDKRTKLELERLTTLAARGWWSDLPPQHDPSSTTNPRGPKHTQTSNDIAGEYKPIPDEYLAKLGPRLTWIICDLGPNLLLLLEALTAYLENLDWSEMTKAKLNDDYGVIPRFITRHLLEHPWKDRLGNPLHPDFPLRTGGRSKDKFEWPPRNIDHLLVLSATQQSAHLTLTLLATAGRIGEVESLPRSCVSTERNGKDFIHGWTYKLSGNLFGEVRQWPAPTILVQALGQQTRLANVWSRMPHGKLEDGLPTGTPTHKALWLSLGSGGLACPGKPLTHSNHALRIFAQRIGMDPKPGGINLHPHRFRKTIGRLAGIALFNSPLVLKRLFGHKSIEMTLHYILCDPDIRTEAERVLRELRILHCAEMLEEIREALATGTPLPEHSGASVPRLIESVRDHEARLAKSGRVWVEGSAYDLAYIMTVNGQAWRFCRKDIICTKVPGEKGCVQKSNCKTDCENRIVLALKRRDAFEIAESYLDIARQAHNEEQYLIFYAEMQRFCEQLDLFPDLKERYQSNPEVKSLLECYEELS